jgi:hypothetical protein
VLINSMYIPEDSNFMFLHVVTEIRTKSNWKEQTMSIFASLLC